MINDIMIAIGSSMQIVLLMSVAMLLISMVNIVCKTAYNMITLEEMFNPRRMLSGLIKMFLFILATSLCVIAFTIFPFINIQIENVFKIQLFSPEILEELSGLSIITLIVSVLITQAKSAYDGIKRLSEIKFIEKQEEVDVDDDSNKK